MLYVYQDKEKPDELYLVKAGEQKDAERALRTNDTLQCLGTFTSAEAELIGSAEFIVIKT